jgi:hypothetical protein
MTRRLTVEEAAAELRESRRWLPTWLRTHPVDAKGEPYYTPVGRDKIFHEADVARIEQVRRPGRSMPAGRRTTKSVKGQEDLAALRLAAELLNDPSLLEHWERLKQKG